MSTLTQSRISRILEGKDEMPTPFVIIHSCAQLNTPDGGSVPGELPGLADTAGWCWEVYTSPTESVLVDHATAVALKNIYGFEKLFGDNRGNTLYGHPSQDFLEKYRGFFARQEASRRTRRRPTGLTYRKNQKSTSF